MNRDSALHKIETMLRDPEQTFILSTLTRDGYPDARLMGNICEKTVRDVTFTCGTGSRKTEEIRSNPNACVYATVDGATFWLYGEASVTREESERKRIWNERVHEIYTEGVDSPRLTIIRFKTKKIRFCENSSEYLEFELDK